MSTTYGASCPVHGHLLPCPSCSTSAIVDRSPVLERWRVEASERRVRQAMRTEGIDHTHCLMLQVDVLALAHRDGKEHVTDAKQDVVALLAELTEAARVYAGCERPQFVSEGEMAQCGACHGCRLGHVIQRAERLAAPSSSEGVGEP